MWAKEKQLEKPYLEHLSTVKNHIYKTNVAIHATNKGHEFISINNMSLI